MTAERKLGWLPLRKDITKVYTQNSSSYRVKKLTFGEYAERDWRIAQTVICMLFMRKSSNNFRPRNKNSRNWYFILTKEHRLKLLENKGLRKVSGNEDTESNRWLEKIA
jgi:hypothetical protein